MSVTEGAKVESLDNINSVLVEFGLRLAFKNEVPGGAIKKTGAGGLVLDVVKKTVRGETQKAITDDVEDH